MDAKMTDRRLVYTVGEVAALLGMSKNGTYNAIEAGDLPAVKIGKKIVVPKDRLAALLAGEAGEKVAARLS